MLWSRTTYIGHVTSVAVICENSLVFDYDLCFDFFIPVVVRPNCIHPKDYLFSLLGNR